MNRVSSYISHNYLQPKLKPNLSVLIKAVKQTFTWAAFVAQLAEQLLPISEVNSSNPVISKNLHGKYTVNCIGKTKMKK